MHEFEGQHPPGVGKPGDVEESQRVAQKAEAKNLHVAHLADESEAEEVGKDLGDVVDDRSYAEERW